MQVCALGGFDLLLLLLLLSLQAAGVWCERTERDG
jgi:hypothetical protein